MLRGLWRVLEYRPTDRACSNAEMVARENSDNEGLTAEVVCSRVPREYTVAIAGRTAYVLFLLYLHPSSTENGQNKKGDPDSKNNQSNV